MKELPEWASKLVDDWGEKVHLDEWDHEKIDDGHREANGWMGRDLIHDKASPVRILSYHVTYGNGEGTPGLDQGGVGTTLTGLAHFTHMAESHKGLCHGGSFCSIMDDIIGWCGFHVSGRCLPWSGYTVQINTSMRKPVRVGSILKVQAWITKVERRKVTIEATMTDPSMMGGEEILHSKAEGLVIVNKGVFEHVTVLDVD